MGTYSYFSTRIGSITVLMMTVPSTTEERIHSIADGSNSMFIAIKACFGGNDATKKTQKALLKQQYENFNATSSESLDSIFNRLQKLVSRLAILGVDTSPEDLNVKFLRSLPSEWDTHVVYWATPKVILASACKLVLASFSDATAYAFCSSQPQGSQLRYMKISSKFMITDLEEHGSQYTFINDQDAPSASTSPTTEETQAPVLHQGVEEQLQGIQTAQFDNDLFINIFTLELSYEESSSSRDVIPSNLHQKNQPLVHIKKWTKYHPLDNVIGNPS
ncbi:hypothetical protein Tco_0920088 [Tanacetum coccineum]